MITADRIIEKRKAMWELDRSYQTDNDYINSVAKYILESEELRQEIKNNPEKLIEMCFYIVDKDKHLVPFFLNDVQKDFIDRLNKAIAEYRSGKRLTLKLIVLKGRQQGFTSLITAYQLACTISRKNFEGFTAADEDGNASAIFENKAKYPYSQLPEPIKPTEKYNNRKQLLFEKLNSSWEVKTASRNMGRSRTINFFHGSEAAFWRDGISGVQAGIGEAMTKDAIQILESTANGFNEYKDLWDSGKWVNCFYEWWLTAEYSYQFEDEDAKLQFLNIILSGKEWIHERCRWLLDSKKLCEEQVYWYYNKYSGYIKKDLIQQEYPCSPDEAFLSSGSCIFNKEKIIQRKDFLKEHYKKSPPKIGEFIITWDDPDKMNYPTAYRWTDTPRGCIKIYNDVKLDNPYTLGGDTKGEGSDWFSGTVKNNNTGIRCATLHMEGLRSKPYTSQMWALGMYFNTALIGIEMNFNTYPIELLDDWRYPRQYMREKFDSFTKEVKKAYGWKTDGNTRPLILENEITTVDESIESFFDIDTLSEMLTFVKDKDGRYDAESGKHDDLLFSDMIADAIGSQQTRVVTEKARDDNFYKDDDGDGSRNYGKSDLEGWFD
jgi:hypothetical protein